MDRSVSYNAWKAFIEHGVLDEAVPRFIALSWQRCKAIGLDPYSRNLTPTCELYALKEKNEKLINSALPVVRLLHELTKGSGFIVVLVDKDGYVLDLAGDNDVILMARANGLVPGANRSEERAGTNAIGLALKLDQPIQIAGCEHYNFYHHRWTCSAAPIHDTNGELLGVIDISGHYSLLHKHTLGMVAAAAKAIEREIGLKQAHHEIRTANQFLNAVLESVNDGLVAVNREGLIANVNAAASRICGRPKEELLATPAGQVLMTSPPLEEILATGAVYLDREAYCLDDRGRRTCFFLSTYPIRDEGGQTVGAVALIREKKSVHRLVHNVVGARAVFRFEDIIGESQEIREAIATAKAAAPTDCRVLLQGETGTGKELFAQAIHNASPRQNGPFVAVNCGAIPRELIESELFGYEEGAFTGAKRGGKPGKFELAEGGTLFLDEVDSMPLDMQAKLLRVIQENRLMRVGGTSYIDLNIRILAASNKDLEKEVARGNFRIDLFYRLSVVTVNIPPLRQRGKDVLVLANHLCSVLAKRLGKPVRGLTREAEEALLAYDWPGNVRELENVIERALILTRGEWIDVADLPEHLRNPRPLAFCPTSLQPTEAIRGTSLAEAEKEAITNALNQTGGNILRAAKLLGITRNTLYRKIRHYGLQIPSHRPAGEERRPTQLR